MSLFSRRLLVNLLVSLLAALAFAPALAFETPESAQQQIEEMVARCNGDKTCELVVRKRETRSAEHRLQRAEQDRVLKENDPVSYYISLWKRYVLFVLALCGTVGIYIVVMNRLFKKKR